MNTRCPAWCDRILMSHTAQEFIHRVSQCLSQCLLSLYLNLEFITFPTQCVECIIWYKAYTVYTQFNTGVLLLNLCQIRLSG